MRTALVTGAAGFIGYHVCQRLLCDGFAVTGLDAMTDYYDPKLKTDRLARLADNGHFRFVQGKVEAPNLLADLFRQGPFDVVVHLAAQAGVRHSIEKPRDYLDTNISGTFELLEAARAMPPSHLLIASTSSVYGANTDMPYAETDRTAHQMSFYAASKKAVEAMCHSHAHVYGLPVTLFRFFTVYGPWGRPDMAPYKFTRGILQGDTIDIYNHGRMQRDFTFIDDLVEALARLVDRPPRMGAPVGDADSLSPVAPWRVINIGNDSPVALMDFVAAIEKATGRAARKNMMDMQQGDVLATWASTRLLRDLTGYVPSTPLAEGMARFVDWYRDYHAC